MLAGIFSAQKARKGWYRSCTPDNLSMAILPAWHCEPDNGVWLQQAGAGQRRSSDEQYLRKQRAR